MIAFNLMQTLRDYSLTEIHTPCNNLPGSVIIDFRRLNTPPTAMPSSLKGSMSNQITGYNTKAKSANGQQNINRKIQAMNVIINQI